MNPCTMHKVTLTFIPRLVTSTLEEYFNLNYTLYSLTAQRDEGLSNLGFPDSSINTLENRNREGGSFASSGLGLGNHVTSLNIFPSEIGNLFMI